MPIRDPSRSRGDRVDFSGRELASPVPIFMPVSLRSCRLAVSLKPLGGHAVAACAPPFPAAGPSIPGGGVSLPDGHPSYRADTPFHLVGKTRSPIVLQGHGRPCRSAHRWHRSAVPIAGGGAAPISTLRSRPCRSHPAILRIARKLTGGRRACQCLGGLAADNCGIRAALAGWAEGRPALRQGGTITARGTPAPGGDPPDPRGPPRSEAPPLPPSR